MRPLSEQLRKLEARHEKATGKKLFVKTNGDRFRAMTDMEIAKYLGWKACPPVNHYCSEKQCENCWLEYLRQPVEEPT